MNDASKARLLAVAKGVARDIERAAIAARERARERAREAGPREHALANVLVALHLGAELIAAAVGSRADPRNALSAATAIGEEVAREGLAAGSLLARYGALVAMLDVLLGGAPGGVRGPGGFRAWASLAEGGQMDPSGTPSRGP